MAEYVGDVDEETKAKVHNLFSGFGSCRSSGLHLVVHAEAVGAADCKSIATVSSMVVKTESKGQARDVRGLFSKHTC